MPDKSYIVLQAYGHDEALRTCILALLSLSRYEREDCPEIWIYTDREDWFAQFDCPLPLRFQPIDAALIREWRGTIDFVHRVKIEVLRHFAERHTGSVLYVDTDVLFLQSIQPIMQRIAAGELFMHIPEGRLLDESTIMIGKLHRFLKKEQPLRAGGKAYNIPMDTVMWNAGVLGFHTKYKQVPEQVLEFTDAVYPRFPKHVVEQFAFSYFMQQAGTLHHSASSIFHYWIIKEHRNIVASFFEYFKEADWEALMRYSVLIQIPELIQDKCSFFINRSIGGKMRQLAWTPPLPDWSALVKEM